MIKINLSGTLQTFAFNEKKVIKRVIKTTFKYLKITSKHEINFLLTDMKTIHQYNLQYRKIDRPTDIISFAYFDSLKPEEIAQKQYPYLLGDIIICLEKVREQAIEYGHSELREFAFLVTHGILHLLGFDHQNPEDERVMFQLQDSILDKLKISR